MYAVFVWADEEYTYSDQTPTYVPGGSRSGLKYLQVITTRNNTSATLGESISFAIVIVSFCSHRCLIVIVVTIVTAGNLVITC